MKEYFNKPLNLTMFLLLCFYIAIMYFRPNFLFMKNDKKNKKLKIFGTGSKNNKTIFPLWFIILVFCIICYPLLCIILKT